MNKEFFMRNRRNLMNKIEDNSIVILFSGKAPYKSGDEVYPFTPNRNFYYLTAIDRENIILMLKKRNGKFYESLFIEEPDPVMARWVGEKLSSFYATKISGIKTVDYIKNLHEELASLILRFNFHKLYLDFERQEWNIPSTESEKFSLKVKEKYPYVKLKNIYYDICELRTVKSKEEIEKIKKAINITGLGIEKMMKNAKPSMKEYEIEAYFDYVLTSKGVKDKAFKTIAAAGENGTILHYSDNKGECKKNDLILFDLGAQVDYYNGDISRTFPVSGKFTERQKQVYNVVLKTNEEIIKAAKPGMLFSELNEIAKKVLTKGCKELGLIKEKSELDKYYFHGVSHYLGLDTHDVGDRKAVLEPGMVLTDEPGLYIPEENIGIRIEDDILITKSGCENLSKNIIKTVEEIEEFMNKRA